MSMIFNKMRNIIRYTFEPTAPVWKIKVDGRDFIATRDFARYVLSGVFEPQTQDYLLSHIQPNDTFLDVGANVGFYSFLFAPRCSAVYAVEPVPELLKILRANLHGLKNTTILPIAASDSDEMIDFYVNSSLALSSMIAQRYTDHIIKTEARRLDSLQLTPSIIKIDVEGAEETVLAGAVETIKQSRIVIVEYIPMFGSDIENILSYFEGWEMRGRDHNLVFERRKKD